MLFNKKLVMGLANILGVLLILNVLLYVVMYVWAFFGQAPFPLFDVTRGFSSYYDFILRTSALIFFYLIIAGCAAMVKSSKLPEGFRK